MFLVELKKINMFLRLNEMGASLYLSQICFSETIITPLLSFCGTATAIKNHCWFLTAVNQEISFKLQEFWVISHLSEILCFSISEVSHFLTLIDSERDYYKRWWPNRTHCECFRLTPTSQSLKRQVPIT